MGVDRELASASARWRAEERAVVERALRGDEAAFALLIERYGQPVLSLCYSSTLNPADAEELAQEVFLAAWLGLPRFRWEAAFSTWLFALARNACVDRARQAAARPRLASAYEQERLDRLPDASDTTRETAAAIFAAAKTIALPLRQALLLRDVQGLSYEEIADVQGVPLGTVRSRLAAARAAVAEELAR